MDQPSALAEFSASLVPLANPTVCCLVSTWTAPCMALAGKTGCRARLSPCSARGRHHLRIQDGWVEPLETSQRGARAATAPTQHPARTPLVTWGMTVRG